MALARSALARALPLGPLMAARAAAEPSPSCLGVAAGGAARAFAAAAGGGGGKAGGGPQGPVYVVFGGGGGIGSALARHLAAGGSGSGGGGGSGAPVVVVAGLHGDKAQAAAGKAAEAAGGGAGGGEAEALQCDARDPQQVDRVLQQVVSRWGRVDAVASCVGDVAWGSAATTRLEDFRQVLETNLVTAFNVTQATVKALLNQEGGGALVLVSAAVASTGIPHFEAMSAAKAGVEGLARATAATYAPRGLRVNCVAPGLTRTAQTRGFTEGSPAVRDASRSMVPQHRFASPDDVAAALAFLMGPSGAFVNGHVLAVDGGLASLHPPAAQ